MIQPATDREVINVASWQTNTEVVKDQLPTLTERERESMLARLFHVPDF